MMFGFRERSTLSNSFLKRFGKEAHIEKKYIFIPGVNINIQHFLQIKNQKGEKQWSLDWLNFFLLIYAKMLNISAVCEMQVSW